MSIENDRRRKSRMKWINEVSGWIAEESNKPEVDPKYVRTYALIIIGNISGHTTSSELSDYYLEIKALYSPSTPTPFTDSLRHYLPAFSAVIADRIVAIPPDKKLPCPVEYIQEYVKE